MDVRREMGDWFRCIGGEFCRLEGRGRRLPRLGSAAIAMFRSRTIKIIAAMSDFFLENHSKNR